MKLKIAALLIVLSVFVPSVAFANDFDYKDGLLDSDKVKSNTLPKQMYDNNLDSSTTERGDLGVIEFKEPLNISKAYLKSEVVSSTGQIVFSFYDDGEIKETVSTFGEGDRVMNINLKDVIRIEIRNNERYTQRIYEVDFFESKIVSTPEPSDYMQGLLDVPGLVENNSLPDEAYDNDISTTANVNTTRPHEISFKTPVDLYGMYMSSSTVFSIIKITFLNGGETEYEFEKHDGYLNLDLDNVTKIEVLKDSNTAGFIREIDFFGEYDSSGLDEPKPGEPGDNTPPGEVSDVNIEAKDESATISYTEPSDVDFSHANIYIDGKKYEGKNGSANINGLSPGTTYEITIKTIDTLGNESEGVTTTFTTNELTPPTSADEVPEVIDLTIDFDDERVDLSWENPPQFFEKAKIYRKDLGATETAFNWNPFAPMSVSANEDWQPLFETNGTEFSDLSIEPENEYEYKVTNNYDGMESNGVTVRAEVPKPPLVDTDEMKLPFGVGALIKSGNGLLALVGGFILLALAFIIVPKVVATIRGANTSKGNASPVPGTGRAERVGKQPNVTDRQMSLATGKGREAREARQPRVRDRQVKGV